ncbi:uncharacterized protein LOC102619123 isoform X3 [Citrus sinensis]|uniref:uncharacterized protein LOC102619123 isoform X3 n=1 Tax=Citrus sinensis TaxID=2711 RepID=UPI0003D75072|nr:uncharacterized protein LOC102619123 isoform X3 [Citrus sinensis]XP_024037751.1 uncharacterized protein LOC18037939 isoform X3 [Citrus x clementina]
MASCDDDFPLLGDDHHHHQANPNHPHHIFQQQSPYAPHRFAPRHAQQPQSQQIPDTIGVQCGDEVEGENDADSAFTYDNNSNNQAILDVRTEKRKDREDVNNGDVTNTGSSPSPSPSPYTCKKAKSYSNEYRKDREEWSDAAIACLLDAYLDKFTQLNRGNLRGRDWEEVAATVSERCEKLNKSVEQCKNKVDNLKKRYKLERHRMTNGGMAASHWPWFKKMEEIVGNSLPIKTVTDDDKASGSSTNSIRQTKRYVAATPIPTGQINNVKAKPNPRWRRVVFKISGVALAGTGQNNIDSKVAMLISREVATACRLGVAIVVGGSNFFCGDTWVTETGYDRSTAYQIGMMASVMNSVLLQSAFEKMSVQARVQTAFTLPEVTEPYNRQRAIRHLEKGRVVIFGGIGSGVANPLFSTDMAAALRASEIHAEVVLKGTNVDGVYDCHSRDNNATFEHISFRELGSRGAIPMDSTALSFCDENSIPVVVFNLLEPGNISKAICGDQVGTFIDRTGRMS